MSTPAAHRPPPAPGEAFGIYLHVPFCARRCDYCAFATWDDRAHLVERYVAGLRTEISRAVDAGLRAATSVFVGGGTPSLLPADLLGSALDLLPVAPGAEVTVECNPDTITAELLDGYRHHGVTRISLGVQSTAPHVLEALGRTHDLDAVDRAAELVRAAGFRSWNVDLIYGAAGESVDDWRATLDHALALDPPHVSAYGLTVEPGTPLAAEPQRHPDDDDQATKYAVADQVLAAAGRQWYEISNWARPGHECRHNHLYWSQGDYRGFGCSAHSHESGHRWWNVRTPERYLALVDEGQRPVGGEEWLDADARRSESVQLAVRTRDGVDVDLVDRRGLDVLDDLVEVTGQRVRLTPRGRLLANEVAVRLS